MRNYSRIRGVWVYFLCEQHKVDLRERLELMNLPATWESIPGLS
jgi:hypothetical protein